MRAHLPTKYAGHMNYGRATTNETRHRHHNWMTRSSIPKSRNQEHIRSLTTSGQTLAPFRHLRTVPTMNAHETYTSPSLADRIELLIAEMRAGAEPAVDISLLFMFAQQNATKPVLKDPMGSRFQFVSACMPVRPAVVSLSHFAPIDWFTNEGCNHAQRTL